MLDVMIAELRRAAKDFYNMTGIKIVLYDDRRRFLYSYPESMCLFCKTVRKSKSLEKKCREFDNIGFDMCERTHKPYIYRCHMGLAEAITPICEGEDIIGFMMMGQVLCDGAKNTVKLAMEEAIQQHGLDAQAFLEGLAEFRSVSDEFIRSALSVMSMCVCYLYNNKIIKSRSEELTDTLRRYVEAHFAEPQSVPSLCAKMYISKSKLYHLSLQAFGMGISDYIRLRRIREAKQLLLTTKRPVADIAEAVGFGDANYFTRVFKQEAGITPAKYRARAQGGIDNKP